MIHQYTYKAEFVAEDMTSELRRELDDIITNALVCRLRSYEQQLEEFNPNGEWAGILTEEIKKIKNLLGYESEGHMGGYSE